MELIFGVAAGVIIVSLIGLCEYSDRKCVRLSRENKDKDIMIEELDNTRTRLYDSIDIRDYEDVNEAERRDEVIRSIKERLDDI